MHVNPLLIGPDEKAALQALRELAAQHPVSMVGLTKRLKNARHKRAHMAQMSAQTIRLPTSYLVTFSIETGHPLGTARHMSMSTSVAERVPNQFAVWMVAEELGFTGRLEDCRVWVEDLEGHGHAINLVQPLLAAEGRA